MKAVVIGSGFAGLAAACILAKEGIAVTVLEKNAQPGGRARSFSAEGFTYDMGPSWYWMPDVFERFFNQFDTTVSDHYTLKRLDPSYQVIWGDETIAIPANYEELRALFERLEAGAAERLDAFLKEAAYKYDTAMQKLVYAPSFSPMEFVRPDVAKALFKIDLLQSIHKHVRRYFSHPKLLQLAEFPILFLGALPQNTPALYSLMNYADMKLGTWYPMGGMVEIVNAMHRLAQSLGVIFNFEEPALSIDCTDGRATSVTTACNTYKADTVIAACDYHFAETELLQPAYRNYKEHYWQGRSMAPSCLLYYLGIDKKISGLQHHNLFFDASFTQHADELYRTPRFPEDPLLYACCPSKTDRTVAPAGCENLFVLIPIAPGLKEDEAIRQKYLDIAIDRIELRTGEAIRSHIIYSRSYAGSNFEADYHAFRGNAYGLANTLRQTAFLKPSLRNKKVSNLFYAGQLTVPGPGVPPALISGQIAAEQALKSITRKMAVA